jgi:hypothetical protein
MTKSVILIMDIILWELYIQDGLHVYISPCDNKSASHWIMFDYFFHVWKVNIFFFLIMFLIFCNFSDKAKMLCFLNSVYFLSLVGLWQNHVIYWPLTGLMRRNRMPFGKRVKKKLLPYFVIFVKQLMTDFCLFQSHLLSQSGNNTVLL